MYQTNLNRPKARPFLMEKNLFVNFGRQQTNKIGLFHLPLSSFPVKSQTCFVC